MRNSIFEISGNGNTLYGFKNENIYPESIIIPDNIKSIGNWAFYGCIALKEINIPDTTNIGKEIFAYCSALEHLPNNIKNKY